MATDVDITAFVEEWRERQGKSGIYRYALARIDGHPEGVTTAVCYDTVGGIPVPLGHAFRARVQKGPRGWRITHVFPDFPFQALKDVDILVARGPDEMAAQIEHDGVCFDVSLEKKTLWAAGLALAAPGARLRGDVVVKDGAVVVTDLRWPTQADLLLPDNREEDKAQQKPGNQEITEEASNEPSVPPRTSVLVVGLRWNEKDKKGAVAYWHTEFKIAFSSPVFAHHVAIIGLRDIQSKHTDKPYSQEQLAELLEAEEKEQTTGLKRLSSSILSANLTWSDRDHRWLVARLTGPRGAAGSKLADGFIDWTEATVTEEAAVHIDGVTEDGAPDGVITPKDAYVTFTATAEAASVEARFYIPRDRPWMLAALSQGRKCRIALAVKDGRWSAPMVHRILPK